MGEKDSKPNYMLWIILGVCALLFLLGIVFYFLWRKISSTDLISGKTSTVVEDLRIKVKELETELKNKDEKIQELNKAVGEIRTKNVEFTYQMQGLLEKTKRPVNETVREIDS